MIDNSMTYQIIEKNIKEDLDYILDEICFNLNNYQVSSTAQHLFKIECYRIFDEVVTKIFNAPDLTGIYFNHKYPYRIFECSTKNTVYCGILEDTDILSLDMKYIVSTTLIRLKNILFEHFASSRYFSPENYYFVIKFIQENPFNLTR